MPTYDYRCDACGAETIVVCLIVDKPTSVDCTCGKPMEQVIGPLAIIFKGTGWTPKGGSE